MGDMGDWEDMLACAERQSGPRESVALGRLRTMCEMSTPISLMAAHMVLSCAGHLRAASPDGVILELPHPPPPHDSLDGAMVAISFPVAGRAAGFTGRVTGVQPRPGGALAVVVEVPERIHVGQQRASVRVPVPPGTLRAGFLCGETLRPVVAIDLSLKGILIEFREGEVPEIEQGHRRMLELTLGRTSVTLEAEVRRRDGSRYGLLFIVRGERSAGLVQIVTELQYLWSARPGPGDAGEY